MVYNFYASNILYGLSLRIGEAVHIQEEYEGIKLIAMITFFSMVFLSETMVTYDTAIL